MENNQYLGTERVGKLLARFAIPCIFSLIISCLYNIVDQIFVGNAALNSFLSGVVIIAISYFCGDGLLQMIGATDANLAMAHDYGFIIYAMMPLAMVQNTLASIIRADGSPRYAMGAMLIGAVINIIGDPVAIFMLRMGIKGAAYATILGQFVSFLICAAYLFRSKTFHICKDSFRLDFTLLKRIMALGTSSLLTQLSIVVITVVNNVLLVRYGALSVYGADIPLAAFVVIMKLFQIVLNIAIGIAAGAQPIVGYNYGAGKFDRVKELLKLIIGWTAIVCLICTVLFEAIPQVFILMFGADGELYTHFAVLCLRIYLSLILITCVQKVCAIFLQSIGHAKAAAPLSVIRDVFLIVFSLIVPMFLGVTGIFWAAPIADLLAIAITAQDQAIRKVADAGSCVIVGHSADYVLRNYKNIVRIFITAPKEYRVRKVMEMYGDSVEQAKKSIARSDAARKSYYESITGKKWGDSHRYELCVDSSIGVEETANLISSYIKSVSKM